MAGFDLKSPIGKVDTVQVLNRSSMFYSNRLDFQRTIRRQSAVAEDSPRSVLPSFKKLLWNEMVIARGIRHEVVLSKTEDAIAMKIFTPLPGEYVASALQRGNEMLGIRTLPHEDFRIRPIPRTGYGRKGIGGKAEIRGYAIFKFPSLFTERKITEEVLHNHTLYPLTAALGRPTNQTIVTPAYWKKICPECAFEDFENHGTAYVHRSHVQSYVKVCSIHGSDLITICPACSTPINKHKITQLGICSQKYKNPTRQWKSPNHLYSIFIAELLNYKGPPAKTHNAEWIVTKSLYRNYFDEIYGNYGYVSEIIVRELGTKTINPYSKGATDYNFVIQAFLGCRTAARYLDLLTNSAACTQLQNEVNELIRSYFIKRKYHTVDRIPSTSSSVT